jgi:hypothetical protein
MADTQHSALTGAELHEPKGVDSAAAGEIYQADGAGSGSWVTAYTMGWEDFNHAGVSQSLGTSFIDLNNDGAGAFTNTTYQIPSYGPLWDTTNNEFDWAAGGLNLGDVVEIRIDVDITTGGANSNIVLALDLAHGHAGEYQLKFYDNTFKAAGTYTNEIILARIYMGDTNTLNNPAKVVMKSDAASGDSVQVNGWFTAYTPYALVRS